jgi:hypothetical protein
MDVITVKGVRCNALFSLLPYFAGLIYPSIFVGGTKV